jgi:hypothetical protein
MPDKVITVPRGEVVQTIDDLTPEFRVSKNMVMKIKQELVKRGMAADFWEKEAGELADELLGVNDKLTQLGGLPNLSTSDVMVKMEDNSPYAIEYAQTLREKASNRRKHGTKRRKRIK